MGSWPILPPYSSGGTPYVLPRTLDPRATILGVQRETPAGFNLSGKSFYVWIDPSGGGAPVQRTISFVDPDPWTLDEVVTRINSGACMNEVVASKDNGFLRLTSPRAGASSYLRIETLPASGTSVLVELGLFAKTEARGGQIRQAQHIDPDRQVANPGQLSWMEGEPFESQVFNRMTYQLGINSDRAGFLLDKKRVAVRVENDVNYTVRSPDPEGIQLSGWVYTGDVSGPGTAVLEKWFAILDADGNELMKENEIEVAGTAYSNYVFAWDSDKKYQKVTCASGPFLPAHGTGDYYIKGTDLVSPLNNKLLKVITYHSATEVIVNPVDPTTGAKYEINETARTASVKQVLTVRCLVDGIYDKPSEQVGAQRVEYLKGVKHASIAITRIEKNNRVFCSGANFLSANPVREGDLVEWSSAAPDDPYGNNGFYRVTAIIDKETLELASEDFGPVYLNPDIGGYLGDIEVTTDGKFWENPWIQLKAFPNGAIPGPSQPIKVVYLGMSNLRDATDDPVALVGSGVRYNQELDENVQKAILAIIGPSATTITDYLYGDRDNNLENIFNLFWNEHSSESGRHTVIRPDRINMEPGLDDETITVRNGPTDSVTDIKVRLRNYSDTDNLFALSGGGYASFGDVANSYPLYHVTLPTAGTFAFEGKSTSLVASVVTYGSTLPSGTYRYRVAMRDAKGGYCPSSDEYPAVIATSNTRIVKIRWSTYQGHTAGGAWALFRKKDGETTWYWQVFPIDSGPSKNTFIDTGAGWTAASVDPTTLTTSSFTGLSTALNGSDTVNWIGSDLLVGGSGRDANAQFAPLMVKADGYTTDMWGALYGRDTAVMVWRPGGSEHTSGVVDGIGSPRYRLVMGVDATTGLLTRDVFEYFDGAAWVPRLALSTTGTRKFQFQDEAFNTDVEFDLSAGANTTFQNQTSTTDSTINILKTYGNMLRLRSTTAAEELLFGIQSGGNFYLDSGNSLYPVVVDTDSGRLAVGFTSKDVAFNSSYTLDVNNAARIANETAGSESLLRIGGRQTTDALSYLDLVTNSTYTTYSLRLLRQGGANGNTYLSNRGNGKLFITNYGPYDSPYNGEHGDICLVPGVSSGEWEAVCIGPGSTSGDPLNSYFFLSRNEQVMFPGSVVYAGHIQMGYANIVAPNTGSCVGLFIECDRHATMDDNTVFDEITAQRINATMSTDGGYDFTVTNFSGLDINLNAYANGGGGPTDFTYANAIQIKTKYSGSGSAGTYGAIFIRPDQSTSAGWNYRAIYWQGHDINSYGVAMGAYATVLEGKSVFGTSGSYGAAFFYIGKGPSSTYSTNSYGYYVYDCQGNSNAAGLYVGMIIARNTSGSAFGININNVGATAGSDGRGYGIQIQNVNGGATTGVAYDIHLYTPPSGATRYLMKHQATAGNWDISGNFNSASSRDHKENIRELDYDEAKSVFLSLTPSVYNYKPEFNPVPAGNWKTDFAGFIAEDAPDLVATWDRKTVAPMPYISVLTKIMQRLYEEVETLKAQVAALQEA
jgi:hypothetical protein